MISCGLPTSDLVSEIQIHENIIDTMNTVSNKYIKDGTIFYREYQYNYLALHIK
jgi:hypothetical protein